MADDRYHHQGGHGVGPPPGEPPEASYVGLGIAVLSLIVMPWLARQKRKIAAKINSTALQADSRQTSICAYLSAILLGDLLLNAKRPAPA